MEDHREDKRAQAALSHRAGGNDGDGPHLDDRGRKISTWERHVASLSGDGERETIENLRGFLEVLKQWDSSTHGR
jgi:hypothetical protein